MKANGDFQIGAARIKRSQCNFEPEQESRRPGGAATTHADHSAGAAKRRVRPESDCETSPTTDPKARLAVRSGRTCRPAGQAGPPNHRVRSWP